MPLSPPLTVPDWQAPFTGIVIVATLAAMLVVGRSADMAMIGGVVALLAAGILSPPRRSAA